MKELAAKRGYQLVSAGVEGLDAFMKEKIRIYSEVAKSMGLGK